MVSLREYLDSAGKRLQIVNQTRSVHEARLIFAFVLGCRPEEILIRDREPLPEDAQNKINELIERRLRFEPMAYILQKKEFYGLNFYVDPSVLIPRPETESLVTGILEWVEKQNLRGGKILDLGTGSGCIAITLAEHLGPQFEITGLDISEKALAVAEKNRAAHSVENIRWLKGDLFKEFEILESFNIIVSNPPYIPTAEMDGLELDIKNFEPLSALEAGKDGLRFLKPILENWSKKLLRPGLMALETMGSEQQEALIAEFRSQKPNQIWKNGPHLFFEF